MSNGTDLTLKIKKMTKTQFKKHFKDIKNMLWLWQWRVGYNFNNKREWIMGTNIMREFVYSVWEISFNKDILKMEDNAIIESIIHELLHCVLWFYERDLENIENYTIHWHPAITKWESSYIRNSLIDKEEIIISTMSLWLRDIYLANLQFKKKLVY